MIIDRLVLKNFKRFRDEEIHFKDGITGILGNNGTGKSSIVDAIFFALYGVRSTGINSNYIVSSFAGDREKCEVRLDFEIGGEKYSVVRNYSNKGKHTADVFIGSRHLATGVDAVEKEITRIIGMGPSDFKNTIYAAQKDLLSLLDSSKDVRKKWFQRALGIDYLNIESQKILKERGDVKNAELQMLEGECKALIERRSAEDIDSLQASIVTFRNTIAATKKQIDILKEKKKQVDAELRQFADKKTEYTKLIERRSSLSRETEGLVHQCGLIKTKIIDLVQQEREYRDLEQRISQYPEKKLALELLKKQKSESDQMKAEIRFAERDITDLKSRVEKTQAKIAALNKDAEKMSALAATIRKNLLIGPEIPDDGLEQFITSRHADLMHMTGTLSARQNRLIAEQKKLLTDFDIIKNAGADGVCPLCRQKLGTHYMSIEQEFESRLQSIQNEALKVCAEQEHVTAEKTRINNERRSLTEIRTLSGKLTTRETIEAEIADLHAQKHTKERTLLSLIQKLKDLGFDEAIYFMSEKEVKELEQIQVRFNDLRENLAKGAIFKKQITDLQEQITQKQAEHALLTSDIECSSFDPQKGTSFEKARDEIDAFVRAAETDNARTSKDLEHTEYRIVEYKKAEVKIAEMQKCKIALEEEIELLKLTRTVIADYVVYLMQVVKSRIQGEVSRIISEITGGRYEQVLLDEDFNLLVRDVDDDYTIDRFSGGEQDDIAVALRIALSRYLAELHQVHESTILIFDEIFGSQDEERRTSLLTTLRTQESRFPQIILISHISDMQGEFANTLVVEMGTDMVSRVREVGD